ncbi:hypothetical protein IT157_06170 [bacterium]|nr:hypothetical protein [bacterium]
MKRVISSLILTLIASSLMFAMGGRESKDQTPSTPAAPASGVTGKIEIWEGNFMPMIDKDRREQQIKPGANMKVRIHEPAKGLLGTVVAEVPTSVVAETVSDESGRFTIPVRKEHTVSSLKIRTAGMPMAGTATACKARWWLSR